MRSLVRRSAHSASASSVSLLVSPPYFQFQPPDRDVVYTTCPQLVEPSSRLTSRPVASLCKLFPNSKRQEVRTILDCSIQTAAPMDLKGGLKPDNKKRGPVTALLSRQNSKTGRGSTPVSSDQDSPPIVPDTIDSPLLSKKTASNGAAGSVSRTPSIRSKQGEPSGERNNESPLPKSRDQTPLREGSEPIGDDSLGNKVAGKRMVDSARKKILWLASKSEWGSLEQAMKTLEQTAGTQKNSSDPPPLAGIQDEVLYYLIHSHRRPAN